MRVDVLIIVEQDGKMFHAYAPALKGLHVDGDTSDEAFRRVCEAVTVYLQSIQTHGDPWPSGPGIFRYDAQKKEQRHTLTWNSADHTGISSSRAHQMI